MIRLVNILLFILLSFNTNGQEIKSKEQILLDSIGQIHYDKASLVFSRDIDSGFIFIDSALFYFQKSQSWDKIVEGLVGKSSLYNYSGDFFRFDSTLRLAHQFASRHLKEDTPSFAGVNNSLGKNQMDIGNYNLAIEYLQKVLIADQKSGHKLNIASVQNNLGNAYFRKGDYLEALNFYEAAWRNRYEVTKNDWRVAKTIRSIAATYQQMNNLSAARKNYETAKDMLMNLLNTRGLKSADFVLRELATTHLCLGELALENRDWENARFNVIEAEKYSKDLYIADKGRGIDILGEINIQQGNLKKALDYCFQSLELANKEFSTFEKHPIKAQKTYKIASLYAKLENWEKALEYYLLTLALVTHDFDVKALDQNPLPYQVYSNLIALNAMKGKADCFIQLYKKSNDLSDLEIAYQTYQASLQLIPTLRKSFKQEGSKELLSQRVSPLFEAAIELAVTLFETTNHSKYLHDAFQFVEGSKAIILLESMNESNAIRQSGIPEELIKKELELSLQISYFEKLKNEEKQKVQPKQEFIKKIDQKLFDLNIEHQALNESFESNYPIYKKIKNKTKLVQVTDLQKFLEKSPQVIVEYFVGEKRVYIFSISAEDFTISHFEKDQLFQKSMVDLQKIINTPPSNQHELKAYQEFVQNGQYLFHKLLNPSILEGKKSIIIVPDDILGLLPFEILMTKPPRDSLPSYHLTNLSYLFEEIEISYSYSATLLSQQSENNISKSEFSFIGFAPTFKNIQKNEVERTCSENELFNLKNSAAEVTQIQKIWGGEVFLDEAADVATFKELAPKSDIIHLATHACIDQNDHQFNKIFFTDDYLSNNDLYNFFSESRLTVLSACNTGAGQLVKGEGVMSLSRGFIHAGSPSVLMSLWSVDDGSTAKIMESFYQNMKEGEAKDKSLKWAKKEYVENAKKAFQHPYYWAAFVQYGDARPLCENQVSVLNILSMIGVFSCLILLRYVFRKNTSNSKKR